MAAIRMSRQQLDILIASGKVKVHGNGLAVGKKLVKMPKKDATGLKFIKQKLAESNMPYTTEHYFAKPRMFRFDIALVPLKTAFEYEGIFAGKSRHTSVTGYTRDVTKYNLAAAKGWKVYRYTAKNYKDFESDLKAIINQQ